MGQKSSESDVLCSIWMVPSIKPKLFHQKCIHEFCILKFCIVCKVFKINLLMEFLRFDNF